MVPLLIVTNSRTVTLSPISTVVGSPLYLRSWGAAAITAPGKMLQFLVEDGEDVEYGELIATIEPDGGAVEEEAAGPGATPGAIRL